MKVSLRDGFEYIPEWNGNKKEEKKIKVKMRFQTGLDMTESIKPDGTIDKLKDWLSICESVENLEIEDGVVATSEDIATRGGLAGLYLELKAAYRKESVIDKKKLK